YSNGPYCEYALDPKTLLEGASNGQAFYSRISDDYFKTLGVPIINGSDFVLENSKDTPPYAIINESLARRLWGVEDPLGKTFYAKYSWQKEGEPPVQHIVHGIVGDFQAC